MNHVCTYTDPPGPHEVSISDPGHCKNCREFVAATTPAIRPIRSAVYFGTADEEPDLRRAVEHAYKMGSELGELIGCGHNMRQLLARVSSIRQVRGEAQDAIAAWDSARTALAKRDG